MNSWLAVTVAVMLLATACSDDAGTTTAALGPVTTTASPSTTSAEPTTTSTSTAEGPDEPQVPEQLVGWELTSISLDEVSLTVAVADTFELRRLGLMFVEDLEDLDGMLFIFEEDTPGGFWMKNTLLSLDIAFFDATGSIVDRLVMEPCVAEPCTVYFADGSYRYALEMEAGTMPADPQELTLPSIWAEKAEEG